MKKIVFSLAIMFVFASCSKVEKGQYLLAGTAKGVQNGKKVVIKKQTETGITISLDSTKVKDGKLEVKGKFTEPEMYAVFVEGLQQPVPFIVENDEIKITIDKDCAASVMTHGGVATRSGHKKARPGEAAGLRVHLPGRCSTLNDQNL